MNIETKEQEICGMREKEDLTKSTEMMISLNIFKTRLFQQCPRKNSAKFYPKELSKMSSRMNPKLVKPVKPWRTSHHRQHRHKPTPIMLKKTTLERSQKREIPTSLIDSPNDVSNSLSKNSTGVWNCSNLMLFSIELGSARSTKSTTKQSMPVLLFATSTKKSAKHILSAQPSSTNTSLPWKISTPATSNVAIEKSPSTVSAQNFELANTHPLHSATVSSSQAVSVSAVQVSTVPANSSSPANKRSSPPTSSKCTPATSSRCSSS